MNDELFYLIEAIQRNTTIEYIYILKYKSL